MEEPRKAKVEQWRDFKPFLEEMTHPLLDFLSQHDVKATFFVLGWIAEKYPELVQEIHNRGHEIGCHSFSHLLVSQSSKSEFNRDLEKAKIAIMSACGVDPVLYRAPGFSITEETEWAFDSLLELGFTHDSSVFPGSHSHGGIRHAPLNPYLISRPHGVLREFPISALRIGRMTIPFGGGGYFRLMPYAMLFLCYEKLSIQGRSVVTYFHPRDFDAGQPQLEMSQMRRFKSYVNVSQSYGKLGRLLDRYEFGTMTAVSENYKWSYQVG